MTAYVQIESVWDYPRPPRLEATSRRLRVVHSGKLIAETRRGMRILETSHPPVYYFPPEDVAMQLLRPSQRRGTFCEFKSYADPSKPYVGLRNFLAFYASRVDACFVDEEQVEPQTGDFYGGWITSHVSGPFKGAPGTLGW